MVLFILSYTVTDIRFIRTPQNLSFLLRLCCRTRPKLTPVTFCNKAFILKTSKKNQIHQRIMKMSSVLQESSQKASWWWHQIKSLCEEISEVLTNPLKRKINVCTKSDVNSCESWDISATTNLNLMLTEEERSEVIRVSEMDQKRIRDGFDEERDDWDILPQTLRFKPAQRLMLETHDFRKHYCNSEAHAKRKTTV